MDGLLKKVSDFEGEYQDVCNDPKAQDFMNLLRELREVRWRDAPNPITENERIMCTMFERHLYCEDTVRGNLVLWVKGGMVFRQMMKTVAKLYQRYHYCP